MKNLLGRRHPSFQYIVSLKTEEYSRCSNLILQEDRLEESLLILEYVERVTEDCLLIQKKGVAFNAQILNDQACILRKLKKFKRSTKLLKDALKLEERNSLPCGRTFLNIGANYLTLKKPKTAIKFLNSATQHLEKEFSEKESLEKGRLLAIAHLNLCFLNQQLANNDSVLHHSFQGLEVLKTLEIGSEDPVFRKLNMLLSKKNQASNIGTLPSTLNHHNNSSTAGGMGISNINRSKLTSRQKSRTNKSSLVLPSKKKMNSHKATKNEKRKIQKQLNCKIGFDTSVGFKIKSNQLMTYHTKVHYCCDEYSRECDKKRSDMIVFGKPIKKIRQKYSPYGDIDAAMPRRFQVGKGGKRGVISKINETGAGDSVQNQRMPASSCVDIQRGQGAGPAASGRVMTQPNQADGPQDDLLSNSWVEEGEEKDFTETEQIKNAQGRLIQQLGLVMEAKKSGASKNSYYNEDPHQMFDDESAGQEYGSIIPINEVKDELEQDNRESDMSDQENQVQDGELSRYEKSQQDHLKQQALEQRKYDILEERKKLIKEREEEAERGNDYNNTGQKDLNYYQQYNSDQYNDEEDEERYDNVMEMNCQVRASNKREGVEMVTHDDKNGRQLYKEDLYQNQDGEEEEEYYDEEEEEEGDEEGEEEEYDDTIADEDEIFENQNFEDDITEKAVQIEQMYTPMETYQQERNENMETEAETLNKVYDSQQEVVAIGENLQNDRSENKNELEVEEPDRITEQPEGETSSRFDSGRLEKVSSARIRSEDQYARNEDQKKEKSIPQVNNIDKELEDEFDDLDFENEEKSNNLKENETEQDQFDDFDEDHQPKDNDLIREEKNEDNNKEEFENTGGK